VTVLTQTPWRPAYLDLGIEEIGRRAHEALTLLGPDRCRVCPRLCKVDRLADDFGLCRIGRRAVVASHFAHFGEENCLRGRNGSGTIFFSGCNLRCVFCQNFDISWEVQGERASPARLAEMMLSLQRRGCHNINFVTPEHVVPQILEALPLAIAGGLRLPIVYNTSSYDSIDSLRLMEGVVDIYMPDLKVWTRERARRFLRMPDYPERARETVKEMHRQVGRLTFDKQGLARRGLLVRHLVMPGMLDETAAILRYVATELGPDTYVDLMAQYYPAGLVGKPGRDAYQEIDRYLHRAEYERAVELAEALGLQRLDPRGLASSSLLGEK
jgi:putative pyruvate formate lyase activating enzyme